MKNISGCFKPAVEISKCNGCEDCLEVCTAGVFEMQNGKAVAVNIDECQGCESCIAVCGENAVSLEDMRVPLSSTCLSLLKDIL